MKKLMTVVFVALAFTAFSQEENQENQGSVIQTYTPSKLLKKGQWDIKWFNNLYTQTKTADESGDVTKNLSRETYFTSTLDVFTGVSENSKLNVGVILEFRSNVVGNRNALDVFKFDGERGTARSGLTSIAPAIKFNPLKNVSNFTIQTALHIPLVGNETEDGVFFDQKGFIFQNRFFYDYTFGSGDWQIFSELNTEFNFGKEDVYTPDFSTSLEGSFANNSLRLTPGVFLSYFPSNKFTVLALAQHSQLLDLGNDFSQDFTAVGGGAKYQLTKVLNIEALYTNFVRGKSSGLGQTFNIGLRALF
ncbi:hypothetical protein ABI125_15930 [Tamlana crocina]